MVPALNIMYCPEQMSSENPDGIVEGVMVGQASPCVLHISSEDDAHSDKAGQQVVWSECVG